LSATIYKKNLLLNFTKDLTNFTKQFNTTSTAGAEKQPIALTYNFKWKSAFDAYLF